MLGLSSNLIDERRPRLLQSPVHWGDALVIRPDVLGAVFYTVGITGRFFAGPAFRTGVLSWAVASGRFWNRPPDKTIKIYFSENKWNHIGGLS